MGKPRRQTENATIGDGMDTDMSEDIAKAPVEFVFVVAMVALSSEKRHDLTRADSHRDYSRIPRMPFQMVLHNTSIIKNFQKEENHLFYVFVKCWEIFVQYFCF